MLETQLLPKCLEIIDDQIQVFEYSSTITDRNEIPDTNTIPLNDQNHWLRIKDVICVFFDMKNSTKLNANESPRVTADAYNLFTGTAIRLLNEFQSSYIDIRGDGAFGLFNSNQAHRALTAAVTFKTFAEIDFKRLMKKITDVDVGTHIGIDQKVVLVKKIGLRQTEGRTDRQNEVWAGKPVNMAAKLAALSEDGELLVSDRYFENFTNELTLKTCGCPNGIKSDLWSEVDTTDNSWFDFEKAYKLKTHWCEIHGKSFCEQILNLD
jgi:class 3 adenylate cyclase